MDPKHLPTYDKNTRPKKNAKLKIVLLIVAVVVLTLAVLWSCFVGGIFFLYYRS